MKDSDSQKLNKLMADYYGDKETGDLGTRDMVKELYDVLIASRNVVSFFGGIGTSLKWLLVIAAVVGVIKGWWASIVLWIYKLVIK